MGNFLGDQRKISPENSGEIFRGQRRFELKIAPEIYNLMLGRTNEIARGIERLDRVPGIFEPTTPPVPEKLDPQNDPSNYRFSGAMVEGQRPYEPVVATDSVHDTGAGRVGNMQFNGTGLVTAQSTQTSHVDISRELVNGLALSTDAILAQHLPLVVTESIHTGQ